MRVVISHTILLDALQVVYNPKSVIFFVNKPRLRTTGDRPSSTYARWMSRNWLTFNDKRKQWEPNIILHFCWRGELLNLGTQQNSNRTQKKTVRCYKCSVALLRDASQFITVRGTNIERLESGHLKYAASRDLHLGDLNTILKENPTEKDSCQGYDGSKTSLVYWNCCATNGIYQDYTLSKDTFTAAIKGFFESECSTSIMGKVLLNIPLVLI